MVRAAILISLLVLCGAARAQDIPGIELCTHESRMDRRTGCLQSNVEFLHQLVRKNAADAQQKLAAAGSEIAALKAAVTELRAAVATLRAAQEKPQNKPQENKPQEKK